MNEIFTRRSIRKFKDQGVEPEKIDKLLRAAMQAPSAGNQQPWTFIVVQDKENLAKLAETSPSGKVAAKAPLAIVLLEDESVFKLASTVKQEMGAATENLLLEAVHLDLGAVWLGLDHAQEIMDKVSALFGLPEHIKPFAMVAIGYPDSFENKFVDRYNESKVRYERWQG